MANIRRALSVIFVLRVPLKDWEERITNGLAGLKDLFEQIGDVEPRRTAPPVPAKDRARGEPLFPSTRNLELSGFAADLEARNFQAFSATSQVVGDELVMKFMSCPGSDINWDGRPFAAMQAALREACAMAVFEGIGYNNPYIKAGRPENAEERALSINVRRPVWEARGRCPRLAIKEDGEVVVVR